MSIDFHFDGLEFTNAFLGKWFDGVSPDIGAGTIRQSQTSGLGSTGGITFTPNVDVTGGNYPQYVPVQLEAQGMRIVNIHVNQTAPQGTLGGRLLTFVDAPIDQFGGTVQVAINIMSDGTLKATRAITPNTGIILRGIDQGANAQMALLGVSTEAIDSSSFLEIQVVHAANGQVNIWAKADAASTPTQVMALSGVNTAVSASDQSTTLVYGGYGVTGLSDSTLHHEDFNGTISCIMAVNGSVNPNDPNDPIGRIGPHVPSLKLSIADSDVQWTPDPTQANYLNVNEVPPDSATTENTATTTGLKDVLDMQPATAGSDQVYLAYNGYLFTDTPAECGVSDAAANFEAFVYMVQSEAGKCITSDNDTSSCALTDFVTRRAQSVCTIAHDGEKVKFKPNLVNQDGMWVFLTPLDAPPRVLNADGPDRYGSAIFNLTSGPIVNYAGGEVRYTAPYSGAPFSPPAYAVDTMDNLDSTSDFVSFMILDPGVGADVVLIDNAQANVFNPYTSPLTGFHFREEVAGSPFFWIGDSAAYNGQTTYSYAIGDIFKMTRNGSDVQLRQNATLRETVTVTYPTHTNVAIFMGAWGFDPLIPGYTVQPVVTQCNVQIGGADCVIGNYQQLSCVVLGTFTGNTGPLEANEWGMQLDPGDGVTGDATVFDKNGPNNPNSPVFGYNESTQIEFSLVGGNVVLTVTDWVSYADNMTSVLGNVATWLYTEPYASTNDFTLQAPASGFSVGIPTFPNPSIEYAFVNATANQPLRLGVVCSGDSAYALPDKAGVKDVAFTFQPNTSPSTFAGVMRDGNDAEGSVIGEVAQSYRYSRSYLATAPDDSVITPNKYNSATHGYDDPE